MGHGGASHSTMQCLGRGAGDRACWLLGGSPRVLRLSAERPLSPPLSEDAGGQAASQKARGVRMPWGEVERSEAF